MGDRRVGVVCLTGAGDRAFCTGGDQKQRAETGDYGPSETGCSKSESLHRLIRDVPKPVIAAVNGYAIGGGHVLHVLCDLTIAADTRVFGQTGPRVGSFDAGFGTAYLARVVGRSARARSGSSAASTAPRRPSAGAGQRVVPAGRAARRGARAGPTRSSLSPTALRFLKQSFNAETEHMAGVGQLAFSQGCICFGVRGGACRASPPSTTSASLNSARSGTLCRTDMAVRARAARRIGGYPS